eukprot:6730842-Prymnesium_polylepis.1
MGRRACVLRWPDRVGRAASQVQCRCGGNLSRNEAPCAMKHPALSRGRTFRNSVRGANGRGLVRACHMPCRALNSLHLAGQEVMPVN